VPADCYFAASPEVKATLASRVKPGSERLARWGLPRKSFYLTGRVGDEGIALHAEGSRVVLTKEDGSREEVDLTAEGPRLEPHQELELPDPQAVCGRLKELATPEEETVPGASALDGVLEDLTEVLDEEGDDAEDADGTEDAGRQPPGSDAGGGDPGDAVGGAGTGAGERAAGDLADPVLPAGDADAAGHAGRSGAEAAGAADEPGAADRGADAGDAAAGAGAAAQPGAGAGGAPDAGSDGDAGEDGQKAPREGAPGSEGGEGAAGDERPER
jgi:hypothetical protein